MKNINNKVSLAYKILLSFKKKIKIKMDRHKKVIATPKSQKTIKNNKITVLMKIILKIIQLIKKVIILNIFLLKSYNDLILYLILKN